MCILPRVLRTVNTKLQIRIAERRCRMVMGLEHLIYETESIGLFIPVKKSVRNLTAVYEYLAGWCGEGIAKIFSELHS